MAESLRLARDHGVGRAEVRSAPISLILLLFSSAGYSRAICYVCRFLNKEQFVTAIAPASDLSKLGRAQFAILFRVADTTKRGLVSWDDFVVFETILKRSDADYWIAFQYFDV